MLVVVYRRFGTTRQFPLQWSACLFEDVTDRLLRNHGKQVPRSLRNVPEEPGPRRTLAVTVL
jgi:hypothetical protein